MYMEEDNKIQIIADDREQKGGVIEALKSIQEVSLEIKRIPVGDYLVDKRFVFERKTLQDFSISIVQGRLFSQAQNLAKYDCHPVMILEGTSKDIAEYGVSREAVQGAIITISIIYGIPILRAKDSGETAKLMVQTAKQVIRTASGGIQRQGYHPKGKKARQMFILQGLPGIGRRKAELLIEKFGSVEAVVNAKPEDLSTVYGMGKKTMEDIKNVLRENTIDYI
ncbi:MAG TPA: nuclease [Lentisphaeria bacterium]|nr:nuclease [Lentisphaeria bacterium]